MDLTEQIIKKLLESNVTNQYDCRITYSTKGVKINLTYFFGMKSRKKPFPSIIEAWEYALDMYKSSVEYYINNPDVSEWYNSRRKYAEVLLPYITMAEEIIQKYKNT